MPDERRDSPEEAAIERAIEATGHAVLITDRHGTITYVNPAFEDITGYTAEEAVGETPSILNSGEHPDDYFRHLWETILAGNVWEEEIVNRRKDGEYYTAHQTIAPITTDGEIDGFVAIQTDITEQKQRQEELHQYERAMESAHDQICAVDHDGGYLYANSKYCAYHDVDPDEITTLTLDDVFGGEEYRTITRHFRRALEGQAVRYQMTRARESGDERTFDVQYYPLRADDGTVRGVVGALRDITELMERTQELEQSRNLLAQTEELAGLGGWEFDLSTETLHWTEGTRRIHGVLDSYQPTLEDALEFYHPNDRAAIREAVEKCLDEGVSYEIEARLIPADDQTRWVQTTGQRIERDSREVLQGVIRDITSQKEREQRIMVLNRVLRHNLRNSLTTVMLYADLIETELELFDDLDASAALDLVADVRRQLADSPDGSSLPRSLDDIEHVLERVQSFPPDDALMGTRLIQENATDLLEVGEKAHEYERTVGGDHTTRAVSVRHLLSDLVATYQAEYPAATIELVGEEHPAHGNRDEIRRIFDELLENALTHSDRASPTITVRVRTGTDENVLVSIEDDGPGVPEMEQQTIEMGQETALRHGSGIGLWLVNWLVTRQGGTLTIEDNEPRGTVVDISLPAAGTD